MFRDDLVPYHLGRAAGVVGAQPPREHVRVRSDARALGLCRARSRVALDGVKWDIPLLRDTAGHSVLYAWAVGI